MRTLRITITALLAAALTFGVAAGAGAQDLSARYHGGGLWPGDTVAALNGDEECATATVDASGFWSLRVGADCAVAGDEISFTVNGYLANQTVVWRAGGAPPDVANGITLIVTPAVGVQGSAGLLDQSPGSALAVLVLSLLAVATTVTARATTARRRNIP